MTRWRSPPPKHPTPPRSLGHLAWRERSTLSGVGGGASGGESKERGLSRSASKCKDSNASNEDLIDDVCWVGLLDHRESVYQSGFIQGQNAAQERGTVLNQQLFINPSEISRNPTTDGDSNFLASTKLNYFFLPPDFIGIPTIRCFHSW